MNRYDYHPKRYATEVSVFGLLLALYMAAASGILVWVSWNYHSIEPVMGAAPILVFVMFLAAPLRFYRNGGFRLLGVLCGLVLCAAGITGIAVCILLWVNPLDEIRSMAGAVAYFGIGPVISAAVILFAKAYYGPRRRARCGNLAWSRRGQDG